MKIMFICDTMGSGGAERVIATLSNEFVNNGQNVSILMLSSSADESFYKLDEKVSLIQLENAESRFFKKAKQIRKTVLAHKPDVVISFLSYVCIYTWWALRKTKIPYVVSERNDPHSRGSIKQLLLNKSFKKASGCVFQTEDALNWYKNITKSKSVVIHNPVSLDFLPQEIQKSKKQILYVGRLNEQKNCSMLIDSFKIFSKIFPEYTLKMYGDGPLQKSLEEQIDRNGLHDKIKLLASSKTWQKDDCDSSLFVLSSHYEGMPNVLAEALSLGIPSVSTNCTIGGPKELKNIFPDLLILSKSDDPVSFAAAMEEALSISRKKPIIPESLQTSFIVKKWLNFLEDIKKSI